MKNIRVVFKTGGSYESVKQSNDIGIDIEYGVSVSEQGRTSTLAANWRQEFNDHWDRLRASLQRDTTWPILYRGANGDGRSEVVIRDLLGRIEPPSDSEEE